MKYKVCSKCKNKKLMAEFYKQKSSKDRHSSYCKLCCTEYMKDYRQTKNGNIAIRKACLNYYYSDKGKRWLSIYKKSGKQKKSEEKYRKSKKGIASRKRKEQSKNRKIYLKSDKRKELYRRKKARRKEIGYIPLWDNPFPQEIEVDWHHINNFGLIIPIPRKSHNICNHINTNAHRELTKEIIRKIYCIDIDELISDGI